MLVVLLAYLVYWLSGSVNEPALFAVMYEFSGSGVSSLMAGSLGCLLPLRTPEEVNEVLLAQIKPLAFILSLCGCLATKNKTVFQMLSD